MWQILAFGGAMVSTVGLGLMTLESGGPMALLAASAALAAGYFLLGSSWACARSQRDDRVRQHN
jgi:hypothetical protein